VHVDTFSRVNGFSSFGAFLVHLKHTIFCQWRHDVTQAVYIGPVFKSTPHFTKPEQPTHVFVTLGTRPEPFERLVAAVSQLVAEVLITDKVIVQAGRTRYDFRNLAMFDFCSADQIDGLVVNARYVITQESAGIGTKCLKYKTPFIVMPRRFEHGELPARGDMKEDLHLKLEELGYTKVVNDSTELREAVRQAESLKTGFVFDNTLAVSTLKAALEGA
jgi:UDP-N-acetylglucosamine transferase subunit ALG13